MKYFEILLPMRDNGGKDMLPAHIAFRGILLKMIGGYTEGGPVFGQWRSSTGRDFTDTLTPYRVACDNIAWNKIVARAFELFPDQEAIFSAYIGTAIIQDRAARVLSTNDLAAIDHARDAHNRLLVDCYKSGQISEAQWAKHLAADPALCALCDALAAR